MVSVRLGTIGCHPHAGTREAFPPAPGRKVNVVSSRVAALLFYFHADLITDVDTFGEATGAETAFQFRAVEGNIRQSRKVC